MNKRKLYESIMTNVAKQVKKTLNEGEMVEGEMFTTDEKLNALHDTIEVLAENNMEITVEALFDIISGFGDDIIVRRFKQYAREFNIML